MADKTEFNRENQGKRQLRMAPFEVLPDLKEPVILPWPKGSNLVESDHGVIYSSMMLLKE